MKLISIIYQTLLLPTTIISIGNFYTHNEAKKFCEANSLELIICPAPLSNDSFCTNRLSKVNSTSISCKYPKEVIIDMDLLSFFKINRNISGVGEFIGVYFSVLDYHLSRYLQPPKNLLEFLIYLIEMLTRKFNQTERFLKQLAISLILKCYIMRIFHDYQIGCGIDHLLSNALEHYCGYNHGKAVFMSSIIANIILENKYYSNINTSELVSIGIKFGIISKEDLFLILKIGFYNIYIYAIASRPHRPTILTRLRDNEEEFNQINKTITSFVQNLLNDNE